MAELILGAVGVVPIIGIAIKSFKILCTELNTFQHCSSHVRRLHDRLAVQRQIFENECTLLLRDCLDDDPLVERMIADPGHWRWEDDKPDDNLRGLLKSNYKVCGGLVQTIFNAVQKLEGGLDCFRSLKSEQKKDERIKDTWRRVRDGMRLSYNKSDYKEGLNDIRVANEDLKALCEQVTRLQSSCKMGSLKRPATSQGWSEIRRAAKALYEALSDAWSCEKESHLRHFVKLFLEAEKADESVHMDIAILCHGVGRGPGEASLIQLQVRSGHVAWTQTPRLFVPSDPGTERPRKRLKSVRFTGERSAATCTITSAPDPTSCTAQLEAQESADLRATRDFCAELTTRCGQPRPVGTRCLGHLDVYSSDPLRHSFYPSPAAARGPRPAGEPLSMEAFLAPAQRVSPADRLRAARALVLAVLRFNATPWLLEEWGLGDFSLFGAVGADDGVPGALRTLHLGVEFDRGAMEDVRLGRRLTEDELLLCGIQNVTLHSLGVALLQIERQEGLDLRDIVGVRREAKMTSDFGQRYQKIANMCLWCNFGFGADLGNQKLQRAVYDELIGELETMISSFSLDED